MPGKRRRRSQRRTRRLLPPGAQVKCTPGERPTASACWRQSSHGTALSRRLPCAIVNREDGSRSLGPLSGRTVLDDTLADGHAPGSPTSIATATTVFAGHRGKDHRVSMYDFDRRKKEWKKTVLDREIAAQDLRGGDLQTGDGTPDVVAVGGSTHNVIWYLAKESELARLVLLAPRSTHFEFVKVRDGQVILLFGLFV